ncbi:MAG: DUF1501 domain-containing protein [Planctomycetaceae bacterium]|nr:DUF1501 domain-containing protein [Planctomycetaceae bacterium]
MPSLSNACSRRGRESNRNVTSSAIQNLFSRRSWLQTAGGGLASLGLANLLSASDRRGHGPLFAPRAKRVIHLFMNGGPFQADLFDPKPKINEYAGQRPEAVQLRTENATGGLMAVPYAFQPRGQSGLEISELLPKLAGHADELCVIRSMHTDNPNHGPALFMMNNGTIAPIRPSMGSWFLYGLGSDNENLPGYVVLCPGRPVRFSELWTNGFLPGEHQGTYINHADLSPAKMLPYLKNPTLDATAQRRQLNLLRELNDDHLAARGTDRALEARIQSMETAFRMQFAATDAFDISREPAAVREEYGTSHFANACLLSRRLAERGVRFTQIYYGDGQPWDTHRQHDDLTRKLCADIDQPIAALLSDLKRTGLLEDTLVIWGGEFGRTPTSESNDGRDHNHLGFTMWLAGGGVKGGFAYGATDEFGFRAVADKVHVHDLHATILHLMGLDHEHLTYRHAGRDYRLTDVYGHVVDDVLA